MNLLENHLNATSEIAESKHRHDEIEKLLCEECHAFEKQYSIANEITNKTIECVKNNVSNFSIKYQNKNKVIDTISVAIKNITEPLLCKGELSSFDDETNIVELTLKINLKLAKEKTENNLRGVIFSVVSHELMHNHIYIKEYEKYNDIKQPSASYETLIRLMHNCNPNDYRYYLAYALYAYYYQETQAIISQAWPSLKSILDKNNIKKITNKELKMLIASIEPYDVFSKMLIISKKLLFDEAFSYYIMDFIGENNLLNPFQIENTAKGMFKCAKKSLQKVINNCYYYAYKNGYIE